MSPLPASSPTVPVAARRAFPSGCCCVRRRFRVYTGSDQCKRMASSNNSDGIIISFLLVPDVGASEC